MWLEFPLEKKIYVPKSKAEDIISVHKGKERQYIETNPLRKWSTVEQCLREQVASTLTHLLGK